MNMTFADKIIGVDLLSTLRERFPQRQIVHCHGVFDLFHFGHVAHLESAKKFGDLLVVSITADRFVNKGPGRPFYNAAKRAGLIASLAIVDFVFINDSPLGISVIEKLRPHSYVKGPDYKQSELDVTGGIVIEREAVEKAGGKIVFTDDETESSSTYINQALNSFSESQKEKLNFIRTYKNKIDELVKIIMPQNLSLTNEINSLSFYPQFQMQKTFEFYQKLAMEKMSGKKIEQKLSEFIADIFAGLATTAILENKSILNQSDLLKIINVLIK